jgi:hypothetical protein
VAWLVILTSFTIFCILIWFAVNRVSSFLNNTTQAKHASLTLQGDYTFILRPDQNHEVQAHNGDSLNEGDIVHTDKSGRAELTLFDGTKLQMSPDTQLTLLRLRLTGFGRNHKEIEFSLTSGGVKALVASHTNEDIFKASTDDDAHISFDNTAGGNYRIVLEHDANGYSRTSIYNLSDNGSIGVSSGGSELQKLAAGQKLQVMAGAPPGPPDNLGVELLANGSFLDGLDNWISSHNQGGDFGSTPGTVQADSELLGDQTKTRAHFLRYGGDSQANFEETLLTQNVNHQYVADYDHLNLEIYVKLKYQSLQGGGIMGSEYPLAVEIYYTDQKGDEQHFFNGFYYINNDASTQTYDRSGDPLLHSQEIRNNIWERYAIDLKQLREPPVYINRVVVSASGHQYESYCAGVSLRAS